MLIAKIMRILRSKLLITFLIGSVFCYFIFGFLLSWADFNSGNLHSDSEGELKINSQDFQWGPDNNSNNTGDEKVNCRNSIQGKLLLADDQGYVCHRIDRLETGCCNTEAESTRQFVCDTCNAHGCCALYEYCVSCCLQPNKKPLLKRVLSQVGENSPLYSSVSDHYELCLVRCRTSSQSVQHETLYRDPRAKHCYGEGPPPLNNNDT